MFIGDRSPRIPSCSTLCARPMTASPDTPKQEHNTPKTPQKCRTRPDHISMLERPNLDHPLTLQETYTYAYISMADASPLKCALLLKTHFSPVFLSKTAKHARQTFLTSILVHWFFVSFSSLSSSPKFFFSPCVPSHPEAWVVSIWMVIRQSLCFNGCVPVCGCNNRARLWSKQSLIFFCGLSHFLAKSARVKIGASRWGYTTTSWER